MVDNFTVTGLFGRKGNVPVWWGWIRKRQKRSGSATENLAPGETVRDPKKHYCKDFPVPVPIFSDMVLILRTGRYLGVQKTTVSLTPQSQAS